MGYTRPGSVFAEVQFGDPVLKERAQRGGDDLAEGEIDIGVAFDELAHCI